MTSRQAAILLRFSKELTEKLRVIIADPQYIGVWSLAATHGTIYNGPRFDRELCYLESAILDCEYEADEEPARPRRKKKRSKKK